MPNSSINMASPVNWGHPLNRGLVSWHMVLPGMASGSRLTDLVTPGSSGHHGTFINMDPDDWVAESHPGGYGSIDFDGSNDFISVPDHPALRLTDALTVNAWFNLDAFVGNDWRGLVAKGKASESAGANHNYLLVLEDDTFTGGLGSTMGLLIETSSGANNYGYYDITTTTTPLDTWHMLTGTWDGVTIAAYQDAKDDKTTTKAFSGPPDTGDAVVTFGAGTNVGGQRLNGSLNDIRIYNRALSLKETEQYYLLSQQGWPGLLNRIEPRRFVATVGALSIPVAMHNYYRQRQWARA